MKNSNLQYHRQRLCYINLLLIHNPTALKSSCTVSLACGSMHEPSQVPGLAHLLEHILFNSSQSFPEPDSFNQFISGTGNGGYQNAETEDFCTSYYSEANSQVFGELVARVLDGFCNPLYGEELVRTEVQAVHEQFMLALNDDESRLQQMYRVFYQPPLCRFVLGNNSLLSTPNLLNQLAQQHKNSRLNTQITILLYSSMSIEQMRKMVVENNLTKQIVLHQDQKQMAQYLDRMFDHQLIVSGARDAIVWVKSIKNQEVLRISFVVNFAANQRVRAEYKGCGTYSDKLKYLQGLSIFSYYLFQCLQYIICHASQSSLISRLEQLEFIQQADFQTQEQVPLFQHTATIVLTLQQESGDKIKHIYTKVMEYIAQHLTMENINRAYKQVSYLAELGERNFEVQDMEDYVYQMARGVYLYGLANVWEYRAMNDYGVIQSREYLVNWVIQQMLYANNRLLVYTCPDSPKGPSKKQPHLGTTYSITEFTAPKIPQKPPNLLKQIIPPNPFIPLSEKSYPSINNPYEPILMGGNIHFYNPGNQILKGGVKLLLHNNEDYVFCRLFTEFMDLLLDGVHNNGFVEMIGLDYYFDYQQGFLFFYIFGYNELVIHMIMQVGKCIGQFVQNCRGNTAQKDSQIKQIFEQAMQNLQQQVQNYFQQQMDYLTDKIRDQVLIQTSPTLDTVSKQAKKIKKNKFLERAVSLLMDSVMEWVVVGNFDHEEVAKVLREFQKFICNGNKFNKQDEVTVRQAKVMKLSSLPNDKKVKLEVRLKDEQIQTSTCLTYYEAGIYSNQLFWLLQILYTYLDQPLYNHMRTLKKISYDLQLNITNTRGIMGICIMVTSSKLNPQQISKQIHEFIQKYTNPDNLLKQLQNSLEKIKKVITLKYSEPFDCVEDCFDFVSDQVANRSCYFQKNVTAEVQDRLNAISIDNVMDIANNLFKGPSLSILLISQRHKQSYSTQRPKITTLDQLKQSAQYYKDLLADLSFSFKKNQMTQQK